jgi:hypothetical protein
MQIESRAFNLHGNLPRMSDESREPWLETLMKRALEEGDVSRLEGHGKPLESLDGNYDPDWWLKDKLRREKLTSVPQELALRRRIDAEKEALHAVRDEAEVRRRLATLNAEIGALNAHRVFGPTGTLGPVDVEAFVATWRAAGPKPAASRFKALRARKITPRSLFWKRFSKKGGRRAESSKMPTSSRGTVQL